MLARILSDDIAIAIEGSVRVAFPERSARAHA